MLEHVIKGKQATELLPSIVQNSLDKLPIPKRMRWAASRVEFVRPVHWLVMLLDDQVVEANILGLSAGNVSRGHRFQDRKSTRLNSSHVRISYAVFCLKKKKKKNKKIIQ